MGGLAVLVVAGAGTWWWLHAGSKTTPGARRYLDVSACLLTGPGGITAGSAGGRVWTAMQSASASQSEHVMVTHLPAATPVVVPGMLATLEQRKCAVIVTAGIAARPVTAAARADRGQRFVMVAAGPVPGAPSNVQVVAAGSAAGRVTSVLGALAADGASS